MYFQDITFGISVINRSPIDVKMRDITISQRPDVGLAWPWAD